MNTMKLEFDRRHAFYFDADDHLHPLCPYRADRLWRGEYSAALPELAGHRVRFAIFHVERFTFPPRVVIEHYPAVTLDARGAVDPQARYDALHAEVNRLEANNHAALEPSDPSTVAALDPTLWVPDSNTRLRLIAALSRPAWRPNPPSIRRPAA